MRSDVAALYVDPDGIYTKLLKHWWDEEKNAKTYLGYLPVVAHPPCGPWGRLKFLNKHQDPTCGPRAVEQVRDWGGVLEHPQHSTLWKACGLPRPGELPDMWGGFTVEVNQCDWGHRCKKATWLYCVGIPRALVEAGVRSGGKPTHRITNGSRGDTSLPRVSALEARLTPPAFAEWLIELASAARVAGNDGEPR